MCQSISHYTPTQPTPPRQYPDSIRQPKTPPRNLTDTLQTPQNRKLNGHSRVIERKGTSQLKQYSKFLHCMEFQQLIWHDNHPGSIRSDPDTLRTPFRHPTTHSRQPSDIPRHLGEKEPADQNYSNWICVNQYQIIPPPRQYPDSFRQPKTTPKNLPDTLQTPQNRKLNGQSRVIERKGTSQLKQYLTFLHWSFNN